MRLVNKLGIGSVQFGMAYGISNSQGQTAPAEVTKILSIATAQGIDLVDSASAYGNAEKVLGENNLQRFKIVSKYMKPPPGERIEKQFHQTLTDLKTPSIYGYLAHRPMDILTEPGQWDELRQFRSDGLVEKIGFSLNDPKELDQLLSKGFIPGIIQVPFNYLDNRFEKQMITLKAAGCEIHTRSAFLQGLFFKDPAGLPAFFEKLKPVLTALREKGSSLTGALLNFVLQKPFIDKVVIGVENANQLQENINAVVTEMDTSLPGLGGDIPEQLLMPANWPKT